MKSYLPSGFMIWLCFGAAAHACGPFFPDTVLDKPQAALDVPPVSYLHDLYQICGLPMPADKPWDDSDARGFARQIPFESVELRAVWEQAGVEAGEVDRRIRHYESVRKTLLEPLSESGPMDFPTQADKPPALPVRPLGDEFPLDVADYVEAARLHAAGRTEQARNLWKGILGRPPAERRLRAAWAAWMLAKTSPDLTECLDWYARVEKEIQDGATDAIGLRGAAKAWRAGQMMKDDPAQSVHFFLDAFVAGKSSAAIDLRILSTRILDTGDAEVFAAAAADPMVRKLINLHLHASLDGPQQTAIVSKSADAGSLWPPEGWLAALEKHAEFPLEEGARVAWALYSDGRFEDARKWLELSVKTDPLANWLQAKFDLRNGHPDAAGQHLAKAIDTRSKEEAWHPVDPSDSLGWFFEARELQQAGQGRLMADAGIVALASKDYPAALEAFRKAGYNEDAAYVAERLLSTAELIQHVRKVAPAWTAKPSVNGPPDPNTFLTSGGSSDERMDIGPDDQLRYLLARRLARELRLTEAREFMPPDLLPLLDHYTALDRARRSGKYSGEAHAAVIWRQALIHRHCGAELFSTAGAPDGGVFGWSFPIRDFSDMRVFSNGWSRDWSREPEFAASDEPVDQAIPPVNLDETRRAKLHALPHMQRFHYRYAAADLAWEAAKALPANHPLLPQLYNTAGLWLADKDPKAADRFYQAMVRRCDRTEAGKLADEKRWFLRDLAPLGDLPALPAEFK